VKKYAVKDQRTERVMQFIKSDMGDLEEESSPTIAMARHWRAMRILRDSLLASQSLVHRSKIPQGQRKKGVSGNTDAGEEDL